MGQAGDFDCDRHGHLLADQVMTSTDRSELRIERLAALDLVEIEPLLVESSDGGLRLVRRLVDDWTDGSNRFEDRGESLWVARVDERLIGVCGVNIDPFAADPRICRLRHLYVLEALRRRGVGRRLVTQACVAASPHFARIRLRTKSPDAEAFYLRLGFQAETDNPAVTHSRALHGSADGLTLAVGPSYAPGWGAEVMSMVSARTLEERGSFVVPFLFEGARVLDIGCGPGTMTLGFAPRVGRSGRVVGVDMQPSQIDLAVKAASASPHRHARFQVAEATCLPFAGESFDVVFAHALFEHLAAPLAVLAEIARVVRPGGTVAICSSDWSGARVEPDSPDVRCALQAHFSLRRRAGGEPFAGGRLGEWLEQAGFRLLHVGTDEKLDMSYRELARYVLGRIQKVLADATNPEPLLEEAAAAASRWASGAGEGIAVQRWVHALAQR